jgi:hypothetical protein
VQQSGRAFEGVQTLAVSRSFRAIVMNSPKFSQILAKKCTLVILAIHFSNTSNIKLSKYSLLQINTIFLLVLKQPLPTTFNYHETKIY